MTPSRRKWARPSQDCEGNQSNPTRFGGVNFAGGAYLFFVFNDCPKPPSRLASGTCDDRGVPNRHVETPPQDAIDGRNGVGDVVLFTLTVPSG